VTKSGQRPHSHENCYEQSRRRRRKRREEEEEEERIIEI